MDLARIHSGSTVAGFVVGTTFEATLLGLLALLDHHETAHHDYPLFVSVLTLCVVAWWSGIFHIIFGQMDHLLELVVVGGGGAIQPRDTSHS